MRLAGLIVTALLAVALVAGCGEDEKEKFSEDFKPLNDRFLQLGGQVGQALKAAPQTPDRVLAGAFLEFGDRVEQVEEGLDELEPPDELRDELLRLQVATGKLVKDLRAIGTAARENKPAAARAATEALVRDSQAAGDARRVLARKTGARVEP
jgi:hypothetical protein